MLLNFYNTLTVSEKKLKDIITTNPGFIEHRPNFSEVESVTQKYTKFSNILVIGHGGSITSFYGFYHALKEHSTKKVYFLSTTDPDYIFELKKELAPADTLVIAISKSGETVTQLEALNQFLNYPLLFITGRGSPLDQIATKVKASAIEHPPIGGRYTAFTEVSLVPAAICGFPIQDIVSGADEMYATFTQDNIAFKAANTLWELEKKGYTDVFMPFYSHGLFPFSSLIVQLCHESFGKEGRGQTYLAKEAPESQHHTNQRFFGGPKNMAGFFISTENFNHPTDNIYPPELHSVEIKNHPLFDINKVTLQQSMRAELHGTMEHAKSLGIPILHMNLTSLDPKEIGRFVAFFQLFAVYSSILRNVNPFDQPEVEGAKKISFVERLRYKGIE